MCTFPIGARVCVNPHTQKKKLNFSPARLTPNKKLPTPDIYVPCGQCMECRIKKSREWAIRCTHELTTRETACFITLTFDDEHLDPYGSLRKEDMQLFWKRLRKKVVPPRPYNWDQYTDEQKESWTYKNGISYFHGAEYSESGRPHHHAIIFNYDFPDKIKLKTSRSGFPIWTSEILDELWSIDGESLGFAIIQDVSYDAAAYVAKYTQKKITGEKADQHYTRMDEQGNFHKILPEYGSMSRNPAIGKNWYKTYAKTDWLNDDTISINGKIKVSAPRYYDKRLDMDDPKLLESLKQERREKIKQKSPYQLRSREKILIKKLKK